MIDTHCHIHDEEFDFEFVEAVAQAKQENLRAVICIGTDLNSSRQAVEKCDNDFSFATIGLHPHDANEFDSSKEQLAELVNSDVVGVGECGLDYFYLNSPKDLQAKSFRWQIELAQEHDLPLSLHIRGSKQQPNDAVEDTLKILKDYPDARGVVHSFYLDKDVAKQFTDLGFCLGINGIVTFASDPEVREMLEVTPLDSLVLETDAPFLAPKPHRGKPNRPGLMIETAKYLAEVKGVEPQTVIDQTSLNAIKCFGLPL